MVERRETVYNCVQVGENQKHEASIHESISEGEEKLPSFKSLDSWLHTTNAEGNFNNREESERGNKKQTKRLYDDRMIPNAEQICTPMPNVSSTTQNNDHQQRETKLLDHSLQQVNNNNQEKDMIHWREDANSKDNMPMKRQRMSTGNHSYMKTSEDVDIESRKQRQRSLSSSSGSDENNSRKEAAPIPFDIHEAEQYTNSKPHLSAAALQCATLAASELQSELKATEELLNSAARRRRYMYYWHEQSAHTSLNDTAIQDYSHTGATGQALKQVPKCDNSSVPPSFPNDMQNDATCFMNVVPLTEDVSMNNSQSIRNMKQVSSIPETNTIAVKSNGNYPEATHFTINIIQEVVKRLATVESELREMRLKNIGLLREKENLLKENEKLRKQLEEWKMLRLYSS
ncbi:hypothetical protein Gasu2_24760 [Galdieria sulphuraria]|nr:hypothetical protein Gasu2_24760 [Galdieria sulphuraria]